ncbi:TPA: hypothetical protein ACLG1D_001070 [Pseudomonas aeruginosa]
MKTSIIESEGYVALVDQDSSTEPSKRNVLAAMTNCEGHDLWQLTDVRLATHRKPSPFFGALLADDMHATITPQSPEEAAFFRSRLREFVEDQDGTLHWCTFDGIVRSDSPHAKPSWIKFDQAGFFSREEGLSRLQEMQAYWEQFRGDPSTVKVENPSRQPSASLLSGEWFAVNMAPADELSAGPSF